MTDVPSSPSPSSINEPPPYRLVPYVPPWIWTGDNVRPNGLPSWPPYPTANWDR